MVDEKPQNKLEHECFPQPFDTSIKVWRYLDLPKFLWLIEKRKLYLTRLDLLNDPHEGSTPRRVAEMRDEFLREQGAEKIVGQISEINRLTRQSVFVSCWQYGSTESEAMWRLYCPNDQGVAIQTTYKKLVDSIDEYPQLYIGGVTYIDYETEGFPTGNMFYPVMHKRVSFAHEQEVRIVKTDSLYWGIGNPKVPPLGISVDWNPATCIESVYVNPYAAEYYYEVVCSIVEHFIPELRERIFWSSMRAEPAY
jgi:hypothetical protein